MNASILKLYHNLPSPLRTVAASLRGLYLKSWRYGAETEQLIDEAIARDNWSPVRWKNWQEERIAFILNRAATKVPFYRELWHKRRRKGERMSYEYLENWPILKKESIRQNPKLFVADDCNIRYMYHDYTSGTSGTPLHLWWSKKTVRGWYALFEARARRWNNVNRNENWAILGRQPVISAQKKTPPFWVWNGSMNQLYFSSDHLSSRNIGYYLDALKKYKITHLIAYPSSVSYFANEILNNDLDAEKIKLIITNAEPLHPWQRDLLKKGLALDIKVTYGMAEIVANACECSEGKLHLWPEAGHTEVFDDTDDYELPAGMTGRLICTGLFNSDMPLIRYEVGDRGCLDPANTVCKCGRTLPILSNIEGRISDLIIRPDGKRIFSFNHIIVKDLPICEAQFIQETLDKVYFYFVPAKGFTSNMKNIISKRVQSRLGPVAVILKQVVKIPRNKNGKFQEVICNVLPQKSSVAAYR